MAIRKALVNRLITVTMATETMVATMEAITAAAIATRVVETVTQAERSNK